MRKVRNRKKASGSRSQVSGKTLEDCCLKPSLKLHDAADGFAAMHQVEGRVDLLQRHGVGDEVVDVDLALHVPVYDLGHVGAAPSAAECAALPDPPGDELERARGDLLPRAGHPDDR